MKFILRIFVVCLFAGAAINGSRAAENDFQIAKQAYDKNNVAKAVKLLLPLAEAGDPKAQLLLGYIYDLTDGTHGVKSDNTKARFWYEKAVKQDYTPALRELGRHLIVNFRDTKRGYPLLKLAAERGDAKAQFTLGLMLTRSSWGLPENRTASRKWFIKALEQKYTIAATYLLLLHRRDGDYVEAYKWDLIDQFLHNRNKTIQHPDVREGMTKSQIAESQRRAKAWLLAHGEKP